MVLVTGVSEGGEGPEGFSLGWDSNGVEGLVGPGGCDEVEGLVGGGGCDGAEGWEGAGGCDGAETWGGGAGREGRTGFSGGPAVSPGSLWEGSWDWTGRVGLVMTSTWVKMAQGQYQKCWEKYTFPEQLKNGELKHCAEQT